MTFVLLHLNACSQCSVSLHPPPTHTDANAQTLTQHAHAILRYVIVDSDGTLVASSASPQPQGNFTLYDMEDGTYLFMAYNGQ